MRGNLSIYCLYQWYSDSFFEVNHAVPRNGDKHVKQN